jgi:tetratricopeptide (TPR) repeat protein
VHKPSWGRILILAITLTLIIGVLTTVSASLAFAQQPPSPSEIPTNSSSSTMITPESSSLNRQVGELDTRIDALATLVHIALGLIGLLFAVTAISFVREESRATQIHKSFLGPSKDTLELVNQTLKHAEEATRSAAKTHEAEAIKRRGLLDQQAATLINDIPDDDAHALITDPGLYPRLINLTRNTESFESVRLIFLTDFDLTPNLLFIRGIDAHLHQRWEEAIAYWEKVTEHTETLSRLKSLAWYWIGRERNDLGRFNLAESSFIKAQDNASPLMALELQRTILETKFFNRSENKASNLFQPIEELLRRAESDAGTDSRLTAKIWTTLGNVRIEAGDECEDKHEAVWHYEKALEAYNKAEDRNRWALCGKADVLYALGRFQEARLMYRTQIRNLAIDEYIERDEPRAKVVARTMELICCALIPDPEGFRTARQNVVQALERVGDRLTIYSQIKHRNVIRRDFLNDLEQLTQEFEQYHSKVATPLTMVESGDETA